MSYEGLAKTQLENDDDDINSNKFLQFMKGFRHSHDSITNCTAKITKYS